MDASVISQVRHLYEVERLSIRQVAKRLGISRKRVSRIIKGEKIIKPPLDTILPQRYNKFHSFWPLKFHSYNWLKRAKK